MRALCLLLLVGCGPVTSSGGGLPPASVPPLDRPAVGETVIDPMFGGLIRRISDRSERGPERFETQIYSQLQTLNADGTLALFITDEPNFVVRRVSDWLVLPGLDLSAINNPRWDPASPNHIVHYDSNADEVFRVQRTDVTTGAVSTLAVIAEYTRIRPSQSFDEVSQDGRWIAGLARKPGGREEIFTFDLVNARLGARIDFESLPTALCQRETPDWVAPSPLGDYLVVQWVGSGTDRCNGLETFDIETGAFVGRVNDEHPHGDLGVLAGRQYFMGYELLPDGIGVSVRDLPGPATGVASGQLLLRLRFGDSSHISCQGPEGRCLISTASELLTLDLSGEVERLAHHRTSLCGYWAQPRATWSRDGRYVFWASDWGNATCGGAGLGSADAYVLDRRP